MTVERVYAMTRVGKGDYLLPSNDRQTLFRIYRYQESAMVVDGRGREREDRGWYWGVARYDGTFDDALQDPDVLDWDRDFMRPRWREFAFYLRTRQDAICEAMTSRPSG